MPFWRRLFAFVHFLITCILLSPLLCKTNIVYASSTPLTVGFLGVAFKKWLGKPFVFETVDLWPDVPIQMGIIKNKWLIRQLQFAEKWFYKEAKNIICLSEGMKEVIITKGIQTSKIHVVPNGTNPSLFVPTINKKKAKLDVVLDPNSFIVMYAGTVGEANGLTFLMEVALEIQQLGYEKISFLVIGNGNNLFKVRAHASALGVTNVHFINEVAKENVIPYFQAADLGATIFAPSPILNTNSANKFFDYLAAGLPVLINYKGWQADYLQHYQCGFSECKVKDFAYSIIKLYQNQPLCDKLGINSRNLATSQFDRALLAHRALHVLLEI